MDAGQSVRKSLRGFVALSFIALSACQSGSDPSQKVIDEKTSRFGGSCQGMAVKNKYIIRWVDGRTTTVIAESKESLISDVIAPNNDEIEFVEQDRKIKLESTFSKTPGSVVQTESSDETNWGQAMVEASAAWNAGINGQGVLVAVVDSGVDISHPQLRNQLAINEDEIPNNFIDDDNNGYIDDVNGYDFYYKSSSVVPVGSHATHVSGIILGQHTSGPVLGVAPKAKLLPLNFMNESGSGDLSDAILAIEYAASRGAKVINASWGGAPCSEALYNTLAKLTASGTLIVVAAGNDGSNIDSYPTYPAAYNVANQITIGATASTDRMAGFSNYGNHLVHLMAPGMGIWSTVPGDSYANMSGTSMAAPFVSGAAALLMSAKPTASVTEIKTALMTSVDAANYPVQTKGRLNIKKALNAL